MMCSRFFDLRTLMPFFIRFWTWTVPAVIQGVINKENAMEQLVFQVLRVTKHITEVYLKWYNNELLFYNDCSSFSQIIWFRFYLRIYWCVMPIFIRFWSWTGPAFIQGVINEVGTAIEQLMFEVLHVTNCKHITELYL